MNKVKRWGLAGVAAALIAAGAIGTQAVMAQTGGPGVTGTPSAQATPPSDRSAVPGQSAGPRGPRDGRGPSTGTVVTVTGAVKEYTINREGDYDGFSLADGTLVGVPPSDAVKVKDMFAVGTSVQVKGYQHTDPAGQARVRATEISGGGNTYTVVPPTERPAPPAHETITQSGTISKLSTNANGDLDGFYLGDQILVSLPPFQSDQLASKLTVGTQVEVIGEKHTGTSGLTVIHPQTINVGGEAVFTAPVHGGKGGPGGHGGKGGPRGGDGHGQWGPPPGAPPAGAPANDGSTVTQ